MLVSPCRSDVTLRWIGALASVGAVGLVVGLAVTTRSHVGVFHDDAMYVILARSLATGQGFRYLNLPGAPIASHFPPGYPAVLSLIWRVAPRFPANLGALKAFNALAEGGTVQMAQQPTFWTKTWGMLTDRFGTPWIVNGELNPL